MNCNLPAAALRPKISRNQCNHRAIKTANFSCRSIDNRRPAGDRLAIGGGRALSIKIGHQSATSRRLVGYLLAIDCRLVGDVLRLVGDKLATSCRWIGDGLATGWRSLRISQPWSINIIQDCIRILAYYHTQHSWCQMSTSNRWPFVDNSNALNNYTWVPVVCKLHMHFACYKNKRNSCLLLQDVLRLC